MFLMISKINILIIVIVVSSLNIFAQRITNKRISYLGLYVYYEKDKFCIWNYLVVDNEIYDAQSIFSFRDCKTFKYEKKDLDFNPKPFIYSLGSIKYMKVNYLFNGKKKLHYKIGYQMIDFNADYVLIKDCLYNNIDILETLMNKNRIFVNRIDVDSMKVIDIPKIILIKI